MNEQLKNEFIEQAPIQKVREFLRQLQLFPIDEFFRLDDNNLILDAKGKLGNKLYDFTNDLNDFFKDKMKDYYNHDLINQITQISGVASVIETYTKLLQNPDDLDASQNDNSFNPHEELKNLLKIMNNNWPRFYLVCEDLLVRYLEENKMEDYGELVHNLDLDLFYQSLKNLQESGAIRGLVKQKLRIPSPEQISSLLLPEEKVKTIPGVFANAVFNIIRNACEKEVGSSEVKLTVERLGDNIYVRIINNGNKPITSEMLKRGNSNFIFETGTSIRGQEYASDHKGLGLSRTNERLAKLGISLQVCSVNQGNTAHFDNGLSRTKEKDLEQVLSDNNAITIFELKLPVKKYNVQDLKNKFNNQAEQIINKEKIKSQLMAFNDLYNAKLQIFINSENISDTDRVFLQHVISHTEVLYSNQLNLYIDDEKYRIILLLAERIKTNFPENIKIEDFSIFLLLWTDFYNRIMQNINNQ